MQNVNMFLSTIEYLNLLSEKIDNIIITNRDTSELDDLINKYENCADKALSYINLN